MNPTIIVVSLLNPTADMKPKLYRALGLMSGTSIDGIDAALIETDGHDYIRPLAFSGTPYTEEFREKLRSHLGNEAGVGDEKVALFEHELTELHAKATKCLLEGSDKLPDLIGFHGQTLFHSPPRRLTIQIGNGQLLANLTGIEVVNDFRTADVRAGGNGAPLVPLYHRALVSQLDKPIVILNIGGVSNVTWVGGSADNEILAFDVGPGNALIDDWVLRHTGQPFDANGLLAAAGIVDLDAVERALAIDFFKAPPPKSLDRDEFKKQSPEHLNAADGAATLTMITARAVAAALPFFAARPQVIYVAGGGRHNTTLMRWLSDTTGADIRTVDALGWSGDGLEAEAFAWLAVRSKLGLPLSLPSTTGVPYPMTGGKSYKVHAV